MKNLTTLLSILLFLCFVACGSDDVEPTPPPTPDPTPEQPTPDPDPTPKPEKPQGVTTFVVSSVPDSVKVETSTEVKFTVNQKEYKGKFAITVDTINPYYYARGIVFEPDKIFGTAQIKLNGHPLSSLDSLTPGIENTITFSNPSAVGEYKIVLNVTDKFKRTKKQEIKLKVFSPKVIIKFYQKDIRFDEENYFTMLNGKYTYNPLSPELKGIRVDTIYTREEPVHGRPGEWTVSGQSLICYIGQEGNNDFFYTVKAKGTMSFADRWDGDGNAHLKRQKPGFHGIMFQTSTSTKVGSYHRSVYLIDKWGKEAMATIVYKAFGRNESIPAHATPSDDSGSWWGHRIAD